MRFSTLQSIGLASTVLCAATLHAGPILEYGFNETGTSSVSTGSDTATIDFLTDSGTPNTHTPIDLHTAAGTGVGGDIANHPLFGTDRAYMGVRPGNTIDAVGRNTTSTSLVGLTSWTVSGWMKVPTWAPPEALGGRSIFTSAPQGQSFNDNGFSVRVHGAGSLRVNHGQNHLNATSPGPYDDVDTWVFFAVSYDSATQTALFYKGYRDETEAGLNPFEVTLVETRAGAGAAIASPGTTAGFLIGGGMRGSPNFDVHQSFPGFLDNIRVDGATTGSAGALSLAALESYRAGDVIPEPATLGTLALAGSLLLRRNRRQNQA